MTGRNEVTAPNLSLTCAAVLLAVSLGGCDVIIYDEIGPRGSYFNGDFEYATHRGAIVTELGDNPFAISDERFRALMLDNMRGNNRGRPADFVTAPSERTLPVYKTVAVFNLAIGVDDSDLCDGPGAVAIEPSPGRTRLDMAFCIGDELVSSAWGYATGVGGPDDPKLRKLIRGVTYALIPADDQNDDGNEPVIN